MNKIFLIGRLTKDPEMKYTSTNNTAICNFTLAVERKFSKQGEERQADFINVVAWQKTAEFCSKYFSKGLRVAVEGRLEVRSWEDNDNKKHYVTEVIADNVEFADGKKENNTPIQQSGFYVIDDDDELPF